MVDESFKRIAESARDGHAHPELEVERRAILEDYAKQDTNHDGYLSFDELLKTPLATFDCMDVNHDSKLTKDEIFGGLERCSSLKIDLTGLPTG